MHPSFSYGVIENEDVRSYSTTRLSHGGLRAELGISRKFSTETRMQLSSGNLMQKRCMETLHGIENPQSTRHVLLERMLVLKAAKGGQYMSAAWGQKWQPRDNIRAHAGMTRFYGLGLAHGMKWHMSLVGKIGVKWSGDRTQADR
jgi:hypothetical protein